MNNHDFQIGDFVEIVRAPGGVALPSAGYRGIIVRTPVNSHGGSIGGDGYYFVRILKRSDFSGLYCKTEMIFLMHLEDEIKDMISI